MGLNDPGLQSLSSIAASEFYDVTITGTNSPIEQGDTLVVDYEVSNTGDKTGTQDITLEIDSVLEDTDAGVRVLANRTDSGTLEWVTDSGETAQDYTATVLSADDSATQTVTVEDADALPDSGGLHQWDVVEGEGTTLNDGIATLDLNFNGLSWASGAGTEDIYAVLDGMDDEATVGPSEFESMRTGQATMATWLRPDDDGSTENRNVWGVERELTGTAVGMDFRGSYFVRLTLNGESSAVSGGSVPTNEWVFVAFTSDVNGDMVLYAAEAPDYDVLIIDTAACPSATTDDWKDDFQFGDMSLEPNENYGGGWDLSFYDNSSFTQPELQSWVDDSKQFYE